MHRIYIITNLWDIVKKLARNKTLFKFISNNITRILIAKFIASQSWQVDEYKIWNALKNQDLKNFVFA